MTEKKKITLNQHYQLRVDYDLREGEITIFSEFRSDGKTIECHGNDISEALFNYADCGDHKELLEKIVEVSQEIINWINGMDIDELISEHVQAIKEEREWDDDKFDEKGGK